MSTQGAGQSVAGGWNAAKIGAVVCFGVAGGLLITTLLVPAAVRADLNTGGGSGGPIAGTAVPVFLANRWQP